MTSVSLRLRSASACLSITVFLLSVLAGPAPVSAQVLYGSIVGNVVDESGSAVPGATVTITTGGTGASHEVVTDATGASGSHRATRHVHRDGEARRVPYVHPPRRRRNMNNVTRVDAALSRRQPHETVTVSADTPMLQTDRAEVRRS